MLLAKSCDLFGLFAKSNVSLRFLFSIHCTCQPWWIHYLEVEAILSHRWLFQCLVSNPFAWVAWRHNPRRAQWLYYEYARCTCPWIFKHDKRARNGETDRACAKPQTVKLFLERQIGVRNILHRLDKLSTQCQGLYIYVMASFMGSVTALKREELSFPNGNNFIKTASTRFLHRFRILTSKMMENFNCIFTLKQIGWQTRL